MSPRKGSHRYFDNELEGKIMLITSGHDTVWSFVGSHRVTQLPVVLYEPFKKLFTITASLHK